MVAARSFEERAWIHQSLWIKGRFHSLQQAVSAAKLPLEALRSKFANPVVVTDAAARGEHCFHCRRPDACVYILDSVGVTPRLGAHDEIQIGPLRVAVRDMCRCDKQLRYAGPEGGQNIFI